MLHLRYASPTLTAVGSAGSTTGQGSVTGSGMAGSMTGSDVTGSGMTGSLPTCSNKSSSGSTGSGGATGKLVYRLVISECRQKRYA